MAKTSSNTVSKVKSIEEYRQRAGKTEAKLSGDEYVSVAIGALEAAGFTVRGVDMYWHYNGSRSLNKPSTEYYRFIIDVAEAAT
jgi:hypothetical protein